MSIRPFVWFFAVLATGVLLLALMSTGARAADTEFVGTLKFKADKSGPLLLLVNASDTYRLSFPTKRDPKAPLDKPLKPGDEVSELFLKAMRHVGEKATVSGGIFGIGPEKFILVKKVAFSE